jgi:hypothetical protein
MLVIAAQSDGFSCQDTYLTRDIRSGLNQGSRSTFRQIIGPLAGYRLQLEYLTYQLFRRPRKFRIGTQRFINIALRLGLTITEIHENLDRLIPSGPGANDRLHRRVVALIPEHRRLDDLALERGDYLLRRACADAWHPLKNTHVLGLNRLGDRRHGEDHGLRCAYRPESLDLYQLLKERTFMPALEPHEDRLWLPICYVVVHLEGEFVADHHWSCGQRAHHELRHHDLVSNTAGVDYDGFVGPVEAMDFALDIANQISGPAMPTSGIDWTRMVGLFRSNSFCRWTVRHHCMADGDGERIRHVFVVETGQSEMDRHRPLNLVFIGAPGARDEVLCLCWLVVEHRDTKFARCEHDHPASMSHDDRRLKVAVPRMKIFDRHHVWLVLPDHLFDIAINRSKPELKRVGRLRL